MELYLIRHPRPDINAGICYGQTDISVLGDDLQQAVNTLSTMIPDECELWSSPLSRCKNLAEALHHSPIYDERLKEINFGDWENKSWDEIGKSAIEQWAANIAHFVPPNGESVAELRARVADFLKYLPKNKSVVIVTHGGVMRAIVGLLVKLHAENWMQLTFGYAQVVRLVMRNDEWLYQS